MIESREQSGHRRRITSLASAQSAFSLLCAAESGIKTIVPMGSALGNKILPMAKALALSKNLSWKGYRILCPSTNRALAGQGPVDRRTRAPILNGSIAG